MAKTNRTCLCCGKEYDYCPTCAADRTLGAWHINWCSETCRTVFKAVSNYNLDQDKKALLAVIEGLDIKNFSNFKPSIRKTMETVWKAELKAKKLAEQEAEVHIEEVIEANEPVEISVDVN